MKTSSVFGRQAASDAGAPPSAPEAATPPRPLRVALLGAAMPRLAALADALLGAIADEAAAAPSLNSSADAAVLPRGGRDLPIELWLAADQLALCDAALLFDAGLPPLREAALRDVLAAHALPWSIVHGDGPAALEAALDAITFWLLRRGRSVPVLAGLFARLDRREQAQPRWRWNCDSCDSPECEHLSLAAARRPG